jgi:hypothetical protein
MFTLTLWSRVVPMCTAYFNITKLYILREQYIYVF